MGADQHLPLDFAAPAPDYWFQIPEAEQERQAFLDADFCTIDDEYHFVRGCLEILIIGMDEVFVWGVWVSLSEASMQRATELWNAEAIEIEPPRFGWLSTNIRVYPRTLELKTAVHFRGGNLRPRVEVGADGSSARGRAEGRHHGRAGPGNRGGAPASDLRVRA